MSDQTWLSAAIDLATANVAAGGGPFGAVVVRGEELVATGTNQVTRDLDPSAHAEVVAIRAAARAIGDFSLRGLTLYASCEPCPMCLATSLWARLDRVVYAADREDAARGGFDDRAFHDLFSGASTAWPTEVVGVRTPDAFTPFTAWLGDPARTEY
ncbi:nucleoside deaminase [Nocardioides ultimimeridianus]